MDVAMVPYSGLVSSRSAFRLFAQSEKTSPIVALYPGQRYRQVTEYRFDLL